jgi:hypothetical protein
MPSCYYLDLTLAPSWWTPQDQIKATVIRNVQGNRNLDQAIRQTFKDAKKQLPDWYPEQGDQPAVDKPEAQAAFATGRAAFAIQAMATGHDIGDQQLFRLDSCADTHVCSDLDRFYDFRPSYDEQVKVGDTTTAILGIGKVLIAIQSQSGLDWIELHDVAYCPGFHINLVSYQRLKAQGVRWNDETGWLVWNGSNWARVADQSGWPVVEARTHQERPNRYSMATSRAMPTSKATMARWHARLGHIGAETLKQLPQSVEGVQLLDDAIARDTDLCEQCVQGQLSQRISRYPTYRGSYPFEKVHFDLIHVEEAFNADCWILHFYCAFSGYHVVFNLPFKTGPLILKATETLLKLTKTWGYVVREMRCDNERSLVPQWHELLRLAGIKFYPSPPYTPSQNGAAERSGGVIVTIARKIYLESKLPIKLWPFFVDHAARILNRIPGQRRGWTTPYEIVQGRRPNLAGFKVIGSKAYVLIKDESQRPKLQKLRSKTITGFLIGVEAANVFAVWIPALDRVIYARDIAIDEKERYRPEEAIVDPDPALLQTKANIADISQDELESLIGQGQRQDQNTPSQPSQNGPDGPEAIEGENGPEQPLEAAQQRSAIQATPPPSPGQEGAELEELNSPET